MLKDTGEKERTTWREENKRGNVKLGCGLYVKIIYRMNKVVLISETKAELLQKRSWKLGKINAQPLFSFLRDT